MNPLRLLPRFKAAQRALAELERREQWSRGEIDSDHLERVNQLWAHAITHVSYYRELAAAEGLPAKFASLDEFQATVPRLHKHDMRNRKEDFLSDQAENGHWHFTGGSTGQPAPFFRSHRAHLEMLRGRYRFHAMWGIEIFDRWAFLWGHSASFAPGLLGRLARIRQPAEDWLRNRLRLSAYSLNEETLQRHLRRIEAFRPTGLYGYSTAVYLLAREAQGSQFHCDSLKLVTLTAEPAYPYIVSACEQAFGVPAVVEYGSVECGVLATEWPDRTLRVREDCVLIETPPRDDGRFDILITVLNNPSFPLIRYAIGDVTDKPLLRPDAGFAILSGIAGRDNDLLRSPTGELVHGTLLETVLECFKYIRRYRIHQDSSGALAVTVELTSPDAKLDIRELEQMLFRTVGYPATVTVVDGLENSPAGKHRWITSDFANRTVELSKNTAQGSSVANRS